jgi:5'-3' exonuclease
VSYNCNVPAPLLAVDAPSMLFRAFYALPSKIVEADGRPVNALLGAANMILPEVELHQPRAVVLCFGPDAAAYPTRPKNSPSAMSNETRRTASTPFG